MHVEFCQLFVVRHLLPSWIILLDVHISSLKHHLNGTFQTNYSCVGQVHVFLHAIITPVDPHPRPLPSNTHMDLFRLHMSGGLPWAYYVLVAGTKIQQQYIKQFLRQTVNKSVELEQ